MKVNQIEGINRKARKFLMDNLCSKRGAEVMAYGFSGYLNSNEVENITLIRRNSKWYVSGSAGERVHGLKGSIEFFITTENTYGTIS